MPVRLAQAPAAVRAMPLRAMARAANRLVPVWGRCVPLGATVCVGVLMGVTPMLS